MNFTKEDSLNNMVWEVLEPEPRLKTLLSNELHISPLLAELLINRGVTTTEEARGFIKPELKDLHDPFLFNGMEKSVNRIKNAILKREKILIFGDYDVDGLTATALLTMVLKNMGGIVSSYIPHRVREGYGLNQEAIRFANRQGITLIVTVDCGTNSFEEVIHAHKLGIDTIISDHHEIQSIALPPAIAVINPHQVDCSYPCKDLSGAGIAFKLAEALIGLRDAEEYLDLAALGTVADIVPLRGENRILVKHGLERLAGTQKPGLKGLMQASGVSGRELTTKNISFIIAPRLNAPGRLDSAELSLKLLLAEEEDEALRLAGQLEQSNRKRQRTQEKILKDAQVMAERKLESGPCSVIVLADESWHPGIIGIVAGRLANRLSRPAILIAMDENKGRGSARSIAQFHMLHALRECGTLLVNFGGHSQAAGLVIARENLDSFSEKMERIAGEKLSSDCLSTGLKIDGELDLSEVTEELVAEMSCLKPYGTANAEPVFVSYNVQAIRPRVVSGKHLKMRVMKNRKSIDTIGFRMGTNNINLNEAMDIAYSPHMNTWKNRTEIQLQLKDIGGMQKCLTQETKRV